MITLEMKPPRAFQAGGVVHLKVLSIYQTSPGKWRLTAEDVTPLPGAEPIGYACALCGRIEEASPDGSLPDDWIKKKFLQGAHFLCAECQDEKICRVCGCSEFLPCETGEGPCHWVEEDLCSACVETARPMKLGKGIAILAEPDPELIGEQLARESGLLIQ